MDPRPLDSVRRTAAAGAHGGSGARPVTGGNTYTDHGGGTHGGWGAPRSAMLLPLDVSWNAKKNIIIWPF